MTRFLLVRHAAADHVGRRIAGRTPGVHLNEGGRREAESLAAAVAAAGRVHAVYTGPLERARETAEPLAAAVGVRPVVSAAFDEVDFGEWTDRTLEELEDDPRWRSWNQVRSMARAPGGESMVEVLERALEGLREVSRGRDGETVAVVSHCDVIRPLLTHVLGMPLDHLLRLEVGTASISTVELAPWGARVLEVNRCVEPVWGGEEG